MVMRLDKSQTKKATEVITLSFLNDPLFTECIPDVKRRNKNFHHFIRMIVNYSLKYGEVYATSPKFEGVSIWLPSDKVEMSAWKGIKNGALAMMINLGLGVTFRLLSISDLMCAIHKRCISKPHLYLYFIGVLPELKGQGYASPLMKSMLERADKEGVCCYLDNTNEENLDMYRHYGFEVVEEYYVPKSQVRLWGMLREPQ